MKYLTERYYRWKSKRIVKFARRELAKTAEQDYTEVITMATEAALRKDQ